MTICVQSKGQIHKENHNYPNNPNAKLVKQKNMAWSVAVGESGRNQGLVNDRSSVPLNQ